MTGLISELEAWAKDVGLKDEPEIEDLNAAYRAFKKILSRYKANSSAGKDAVELLAVRKGAEYTPPIKLTTQPDKGQFQSRAFINERNWHFFVWPTKKLCDEHAIEWLNQYPDKAPTSQDGGLRDELLAMIRINDKGRKIATPWENGYSTCISEIKEALSRHPVPQEAQEGGLRDKIEAIVSAIRRALIKMKFEGAYKAKDAIEHFRGCEETYTGILESLDEALSRCPSPESVEPLACLGLRKGYSVIQVNTPVPHYRYWRCSLIGDSPFKEIVGEEHDEVIGEARAYLLGLKDLER